MSTPWRGSFLRVSGRFFGFICALVRGGGAVLGLVSGLVGALGVGVGCVVGFFSAFLGNCGRGLLCGRRAAAASAEQCREGEQGGRSGLAIHSLPTFYGVSAFAQKMGTALNVLFERRWAYVTQLD